MFTVFHNAFNGAEAKLNGSPSLNDVAALVSDQTAAGKQLIWIDIPLEQAALVPLFQQQGFVFHLCNEQTLTMIHRIRPDAYAPFAPTHTAGVGGIVQNPQGEILLVRDKWMGGKGFKIPGGFSDLGEPLHISAEREVLEETGIRASFDGIVSVISKHPHQFGKSNLYIICKLTPSTFDIDPQDAEEIECAVWMPPEQYIADESSPRFHRHMVANLRDKPVLAHDDLAFPDDRTEKHMYRLLNTTQ